MQKSFPVAALFCLVALFSKAQTTVTIASGAALSPSTESGPIYRATSASAVDYSQFAYLYTATDLAGIPAGSLIEKLAWNKTSTGATTGGARLKIYLKNSNVTGYSVATPFAALISGATLVYDNVSANLSSAIGYQDFILTTSFAYGGESLEIIIDWDISAVAGAASTGPFNWERTEVTGKILGYADVNPITASLSPINNSLADISNTRPAMQLTYNAPPPPCTGTPVGGIISAPDSICSDIAFTMTITGGTGSAPGISFQWQSSTDSIAWTNITAASNQSLTISQTANAYYRRIISCNGNSDTSTAKLVRLKAFGGCYCIPASSTCTSFYISNVNFGSINNSSACSANGFVDYSGSIAPSGLTQGSPTNLTLTVNGNSIKYAGAWIDFNHNGLFDTNEYTYLGYSTGNTTAQTISKEINIPGNASPGITKMRIRLRYLTGLPGDFSCSTFTTGETEDYLVNIQPGVSCGGTLNAGVAVASRNAICAGDTVLLSVNNSTNSGLGLGYDWQVSPAAGGPWTGLVSGPPYTTAITTVSSPRWYRRKIFCGASQAYSTPVLVDTLPTSRCYCQPDSSSCDVSAKITVVNFAGLSNLSGCSYLGYSDYTNSIPATPVQAGLTIPISITATTLSSSLTHYFIVWIDFNHNGIFDSSEHRFLGTVQGTGTINGSVGIPANALTGLTVMRVRVKFNSPAITGLDACTAFGSSETEDYMLNILPPTSCSSGLTAGIISGPAKKCAGFPFELTSINTTISTGIRYAWQASTDSVIWTNIYNSGTLLTPLPNVTQNVTTWYRLVDSCTTGTAISNVIKVLAETNSLNCHCVPPGSSVCTIGTLFIKVVFGTIDNSASCSPGGYGNFTGTAQTTSINANSYAPITVQVGCGQLATQNMGVWIDFNQNGLFEASEFTHLGFGCGTTLTRTISIPTSAVAGIARMRLRVTYDAPIGPADACTYYLNGETEDYRVTVLPYNTCPVNTWTGSISNAWENAQNWSCGIVPGLHSNVIINSGTVVINSNVTVYSLNVNAGASVTVNPPYNLTITH